MSKVISLSARKNTSRLSDEEERSLYERSLGEWQRMCRDHKYGYAPVCDYVVLPHVRQLESEFEIHLKNEFGEVAYFVTRGGASGTIQFFAREPEPG
jgi:hypothetical protein